MNAKTEERGRSGAGYVPAVVDAAQLNKAPIPSASSIKTCSDSPSARRRID